jgi:hypothetical protein
MKLREGDRSSRRYGNTKDGADEYAGYTENCEMYIK